MVSLYCCVKNGNIIEPPQRLPRNWRNISGLYLLSDEKLKDKGWLPVIDTTSEIDSSTQRLGKFELQKINPDSVEYKRKVLTYSVDEIIKMKIEKRIKVNDRALELEKRNTAISELQIEGKIPQGYSE